MTDDSEESEERYNYFVGNDTKPCKAVIVTQDGKVVALVYASGCDAQEAIRRDVQEVFYSSVAHDESQEKDYVVTFKAFPPLDQYITACTHTNGSMLQLDEIHKCDKKVLAALKNRYIAARRGQGMQYVDWGLPSEAEISTPSDPYVYICNLGL